MQIKLEYSDSYVRKVFIETGVVLEPKWVEIDATDLKPEDRKRLLAVSTGDYEERNLDFYVDEQTDDVMKLVNDYLVQYEANLAEKKKKQCECEKLREAEEKQREEEERQEAERKQMIKEGRLAWIETNGSDFLRELVREGFSFYQRFYEEYKEWYIKDFRERTGMEWVCDNSRERYDCIIGDPNYQADEKVLKVYKLLKGIEDMKEFLYGPHCTYVRVYIYNKQVGIGNYMHVDLQ